MCEPNVMISIDMKKNRIRIHRSTLALLKNPAYIQLLVNPRNMQIAVKGIDQRLLDAYVVKSYSETDHCYELYSKSLVSKLQTLYPKIENSFTYRFTGNILQEEKMAIFPLHTLQKVDVSGGDCHG